MKFPGYPPGLQLFQKLWWVLWLMISAVLSLLGISDLITHGPRASDEIFSLACVAVFIKCYRKLSAKPVTGFCGRQNCAAPDLGSGSRTCRQRCFAFGGLGILLIVLNLVGYHATTSRKVNREISFPTDWPVGTTVTYELVTESEESGDAQMQYSSVFTPLTIEVLERSEAGYLIAWSTGRSQVLKPKLLEEVKAWRASLHDGLKFLLRTDAKGLPVELVNRTAIAASFEEKLRDIRKRLAKSGMVWQEIERLTGRADLSIAPEDASAGVLRMARILFLFTGQSAELGNAWGQEGGSTNATGVSFEWKQRLILLELNRGTGEAVVEFLRTEFPHRGAAPILEKSAWTTAVLPMETEVAAGGFRDKGSSVMDIKNGWPKSISFETSSKGDAGNWKVERRRFTRYVVSSRRRSQ